MYFLSTAIRGHIVFSLTHSLTHSLTYLDKVSCEYFYFMEEWNEYNWLKPPLPTFKLALNGGDNIQYYNVGDEFQYVFEGRREPDPVVITKLRFDDETGEDKVLTHSPTYSLT